VAQDNLVVVFLRIAFPAGEAAEADTSAEAEAEAVQREHLVAKVMTKAQAAVAAAALATLLDWLQVWKQATHGLEMDSALFLTTILYLPRLPWLQIQSVQTK
jgi:hypothetical protein